jgi:hypothetical protein
MANEDGYEYWEINDPTYPYPLDEINTTNTNADLGGAD